MTIPAPSVEDAVGVPFVPAVVLMLGFPLAILAATEVLHSATRRGSPLVPTLRVVRGLVLPALAGMLFVTAVWQVPAGSTAAKLAQTAFWLALLLALLTLVNDTLFGGRHRAGMRERVPKLFRDLARVALVVVGAALVWHHVWGQEIGGTLTALGLGGIVVGLALQEPLGNIVSGLMLLVERPLALGDWIVADGTTGKVIEINWRSVHIETILHEMRIIPNVVLYKTSFSNLSRPTRVRTDTLDLGFSYDNPPGQVKEAILGLLRGVPGVLPVPAPEVHTVEYGDFSVGYRVYFSVADQDEVLTVRDRILSRVWYVARREGLVIPFPIQMQYRPFESPSPREPGPAELVGRFPRYRQIHDAMAAAARRRREAGGGPVDPGSEAAVESFGAGEEIRAPGADVGRFALVIEGEAEILAPGPDGTERLVARLGPGDFHGVATASAAAAGEHRVVARTDVVEVSIPAATMGEWLQGSSGLSAEIGDAIEQRRRAAFAGRTGTPA